MLDVNFSPPYSGDGAIWDFGIIFRVGDKGSLRLLMLYDRKWEIENYSATSGDYITISKGELPHLSINSGEKNLIRLIASGKQGWFFIDDLEVAELDLSRLTDPGNICIGLGFYKNTEKAGALHKLFRFYSLGAELIHDMRLHSVNRLSKFVSNYTLQSGRWK